MCLFSSSIYRFIDFDCSIASLPHCVTKNGRNLRQAMLRLPRLSSRQLPLKLLKSPILTRTLFSLDSDAQFFFLFTTFGFLVFRTSMPMILQMLCYYRARIRCWWEHIKTCQDSREFFSHQLNRLKFLPQVL